MSYVPGTRQVVEVQYSQIDAMIAIHDANRALRLRDYHQSRRSLSRAQRHLRAANRTLCVADPVAAAFCAARIHR